MLKSALLAMALVCTAALTPAHAEVAAVSDGGFIVSESASVAAPPARAFAVFTKIGSWWDSEHSYSGDARNMKMTVSPGGCWCETLKGGGFVEHMRVIYAAPGKALALRGALGPLMSRGADGVMTVAFAPDGAGTKVTVKYSVHGFVPDGWAKSAPAVDQVLGEQVARFAKVAAR